MGHAGVGERSAIISTIIESCRRQQIDPSAALRDVLTRSPTMTNRQVKDTTLQASAHAQKQVSTPGRVTVVHRGHSCRRYDIFKDSTSTNISEDAAMVRVDRFFSRCLREMPSAGVLPTKASYGDMGVPLAFSGRITGFVVDGTTTPKNPFPGTARAHYLTPGEQNAAVRMIFRPFVDTNPEKGYFEFTFRLVEGHFSLAIGEIHPARRLRS